MAKVKVKVLYPSAFVAYGVDADAEVVQVEEADAATLIGQGWAELVKGKVDKPEVAK